MPEVREMSVYAIAQITIHDRDRYADYEAGFNAIFFAYNGTLLSVDEKPVILEGEWPCTRTVLIEFPDQEQFTAWYQSPAYQSLAKVRQQASIANLCLVEGLSAAIE